MTLTTPHQDLLGNSMVNNTVAGGIPLNADWTQGPGLVENLLLYALLYSLFTAMSITLSVPCGVVTPVFCIGAAVGRSRHTHTSSNNTTQHQTASHL